MPRVNAAAPAITGDVYRFLVNTKSLGDNAQNLWDFMASAFVPDPGLNMPLILTSLITRVQNNYINVLTPDTKVTYCQLACINSDQALTLVTSVNFTGTVAGHYLPIMTTAVVRRQSLLKGQHGRGRVEFPAVPASFSDAVNDASRLTNASTGIYVTTAQQIGADLTIGAVIYKSVISTRPVRPALLVSRAAPVSRWITSPIMGTQRRRYEGRGI